MSERQRYRRGIGRLVAGCAVACLGVVGVPVMPGTAAAAPAPLTAPLPAQDPDPEGDGSTSGPSAAARARAAAAAERAAERAADRAEAARSARRAWESRDRPHHMAIVRDDSIDVVRDGQLARRVSHYGTATIGTLERALPTDWLTVTDGTAVLGASVVLVRGAAMEIGDDVRTLKLLGGQSPQDASSIYTGGGRLTLRGVTVISEDPATRQPLPPTAAGRPFVVVNERGRLDAVDSTFSDLGTPSTGVDGGRAGLRFNHASTGSLVRTTLHRNTTGLELSRSEGVRLDQVTVSESAADGLVLSGDRGTGLSGVRAVANGENGVVVTGESSDRPVTGIVTTGNGGYGLVVVGQTGAEVLGVATTADRTGGLRVNRSTDLHVTDFTATDQPIGVFTHVNSTGVVLDGMRVTGGRRGVVVEKSTHGLELRDSTIDGAHVAGISIGGKDVLVEGVRISDSRAGVRVERGASGVRLAGLVLNGGRDGIVASPATSGLVIADLVADNVQADAVRSESSGAEIIGGRVTGGATGLDLSAGTTISGITISGADEGIHSRSPELVRADGVTIDVLELGIESAPGSPFLLTGSSVHALEALRGQITQEGTNDLSLPPLNLLSAIGLPLILLALVLEQVHSARLRRAGVHGRRLPPAVPVGAG